MPSYRFHRHPQTAAVVAASAAPAANVETKACRSEDPNQAVVDAVWLVGTLATVEGYLGNPVNEGAVVAVAVAVVAEDVAAAASGEEVPVSVPSPETDYPHASGDQELALGSVPAFDSASSEV